MDYGYGVAAGMALGDAYGAASSARGAASRAEAELIAVRRELAETQAKLNQSRKDMQAWKDFAEKEQVAAVSWMKRANSLEALFKQEQAAAASWKRRANTLESLSNT